MAIKAELVGYVPVTNNLATLPKKMRRAFLMGSYEYLQIFGKKAKANMKVRAGAKLSRNRNIYYTRKNRGKNLRIVTGRLWKTLMRTEAGLKKSTYFTTKEGGRVNKASLLYTFKVASNRGFNYGFFHDQGGTPKMGRFPFFGKNIEPDKFLKRVSVNVRIYVK